jgi:hypothetical protein
MSLVKHGHLGFRGLRVTDDGNSRFSCGLVVKSAAMLLDGPSKNPLPVSSAEGHKFCPWLLAELKFGP